MESVSRWRLRLVAFEVRIWRLNACPRLNLPDAVFLKRLAAPLCVFNLGIIVSLLQHKHTCPASAGARAKLSGSERPGLADLLACSRRRCCTAIRLRRL